MLWLLGRHSCLIAEAGECGGEIAGVATVVHGPAERAERGEQLAVCLFFLETEGWTSTRSPAAQTGNVIIIDSPGALPQR